MLGSKVELDESSTGGFSCSWITVAYARDDTEDRHLKGRRRPVRANRG
jgi:hypothetical protein